MDLDFLRSDHFTGDRTQYCRRHVNITSTDLQPTYISNNEMNTWPCDQLVFHFGYDKLGRTHRCTSCVPAGHW